MLTSEAGALVSHTENITMETGIGDESEGFLSSVKDSVLGDESLFRNRYVAEDGEGTVEVAPTVPGDINCVELDNDSLLLQDGGYVAAGEDILIDSDVGGLSSVLGGEGLFFIKAHGTGPLFLASFGGIVEKELNAGEVFTVDSGHAVAWPGDMDYTTEKVGGLKETLFSGEGLVIRLLSG
jgi:TIGR00266 family protein